MSSWNLCTLKLQGDRKVTRSRGRFAFHGWQTKTQTGGMLATGPMRRYRKCHGRDDSWMDVTGPG